MPHAIVVVGNERRFIEAARPLIHHLRKNARCERVTLLRGAYYTPAELERYLRRAMRAVPASDALLVAYLGHGNEGYWGHALEHQNKPLAFWYSSLAKTLSAHLGPLVILNDCCHAESLVPSLKTAGIRGDRCLLVSACKAEEVTYEGTCAAVLSRWSRGEVFDSVVEKAWLIHPSDGLWAGRSEVEVRVVGLRWGAELDHHFFPRKP